MFLHLCKLLIHLTDTQQHNNCMKKIITTAVLAALVITTAFSQELSKEERKRLKEELSAYGKDLAGYKAKMEDIRSTLDSNEAEIKRLKDDLAYAATNQAELDNKIADMDNQLIKCNEENLVLKGYNASKGIVTPATTTETKIETKTSSAENTTAPAQSNSSAPVAGLNNAPQSGTVYKVQIGLYKEFNINKYFAEPRFIGYEEVDGMNRYIISYFPDEEIAKSFVADVRKMGIKDAFVSKYIDGQRVYEWSKNPKYFGKPEPTSLQEALEMDKKGKKTK